MKRAVLATALALAPAGGVAAVPPPPAWSFAAPLGGFDLGAAQRGLGVYQQRCASCHAMAGLGPADLLELGYDQPEAAILLRRLGRSPFAAPPGANAPDLSRAERVSGADALWRLLLAPRTPLAYNGLPANHPTLHTPDEARDLVTFLAWAARPHQTERRQLGVAILLFGLLLLGIAGFAARRNRHG